MGEIDGVRRRSGLDREEATPAADAAKRSESAPAAPWNVDYDKIPAGIRRYDQAILTSPALVAKVAQ
jgi:hypothetical protein